MPSTNDEHALLPQLWPPSVCRNKHGQIAIHGSAGQLSVDDIAVRYGTPIFVLEEGEFRRRVREYRDAFRAAFASLGGCDVYYAGKALLTSALARWVADEGIGLDVATGGELAVARRVDFPGQRIGMHGNNKSEEEIRQAIDYGVGRIVIDSFDEIERVARLAEAAGSVVPVAVRVTVGVSAHTHEFIQTAHEDQKFGLSLASGAATEAVRRIVAASPHLRLVGAHSHIGSQIFSLEAHAVAMERLSVWSEELDALLSVKLDELDLGGGFGVAYTDADAPMTITQIARQLAAIVEERLPRGLPVPHFSIEPGRAIVGPSTFTLYRVGTVKQVQVDGEGPRTYVSVDGGMSDNIRPALYGADYTAVLANRSGVTDTVRARVVGKHCEAGDIVVRDVQLPADIAPGDLLAVPVTGAYGYSMASNYNHVPRPPIVAVRDGVPRVIVRRETQDDLFRLDVDE